MKILLIVMFGLCGVESALLVRKVFARKHGSIPLTRQTSLIMKKFDQVCSVALNVFANKPGGSVNILINCSKTIDRRPNFRRCASPEGGRGGFEVERTRGEQTPFEKRLVEIYRGEIWSLGLKFEPAKCHDRELLIVSVPTDGKYHMLSSGELMILNITREDAERSYRCRTHHRLTQETVVSSNVGRLQLTGECVKIHFAPASVKITRFRPDERAVHSEPDRKFITRLNYVYPVTPRYYVN
ncbi:hypothetical protein K0M31_017482 [Melipona bicolor]|uniref:Uncharacterized protein n=1 Tax=Melipona bicolor TaxID=60889 RepID=A0AA40G665_9HYME|nr:hypothetical protein K0M31_017482 [Melipona bicolor]